jgi:hypothetical protein
VLDVLGIEHIGSRAANPGAEHNITNPAGQAGNGDHHNTTP